jgi:prepilin-type N-terminal cleavage/methylation domain-containing protein
MKKHRGFTLVEVMVVVAIISILIAAVAVSVNPTSTPRDVSQRVADLVREASREAVAYGTVRPNVAAANAGLGKGRACVTGAVNASGQTVFSLNLLQEAATTTLTTYQWTAEASYTVPPTIQSYAYATSVGTYASVTPLTTWASFNLCCYADGTCDPYSLFFQNTRAKGGVNYQARVSVLPLGAQPIMRSDFTSL